MERQSLALAYQLQQEERAAYTRASIHYRSASIGGGEAAGHRSSDPADASDVEEEAADDNTMEEEGMDESLRLAMMLQQEELQWHAAASGMHEDGGDMDEDLRLAIQLSREDS